MSASQQAIAGHGMTRIESAVMARFDAGERNRDIARAEGITEARVTSIIYSLRENASDRWEAEARRGSVLLLAAIRRLQARASA